MARVLVVDDEVGVQESLRMLLKPECDVVTAGRVEDALRALTDTPPDLILLDLVMPGRSGLDLLAELKERGYPAPVVILTATKTIATAVEAMKSGAADYVTKPFEVDALRIKVRQLLERRALEEEVARLRDAVDGRQRLGRLVGRSEAMQRVFRSAERVAQSEATVLVMGESGTGKELLANAIHTLGPRAAQPFVAINCGAIPHNLIESELFGAERGAYTGAQETRIGRFEAAHTGTLFLDEIGELEQSVQVKLLRALQERTIERLGSTQPIEVDVRVIAATNRDLEQEVAEGRFRQDLFYRINVVPLTLPPLRDRREDVRLLTETFLARHQPASGERLRVSPAALAALDRYSWPGNVRELENAIEHGAALCEAGVIELENLPQGMVRTGRGEAIEEEWRSGEIGLEEAVQRFETSLLREALEREGWNQTRAAARLGITRRLLKLKMDRSGLTPPRPDEG
ncbi:MAG: sigma-54 dependent transcriptional regulator [Proteobacteria bacterium]|nr:sigma-54 dependent transcriptional regulator [Pseudomonadota bacterium]